MTPFKRTGESNREDSFPGAYLGHGALLQPGRQLTSQILLSQLLLAGVRRANLELLMLILSTYCQIKLKPKMIRWIFLLYVPPNLVELIW